MAEPAWSVNVDHMLASEAFDPYVEGAATAAALWAASEIVGHDAVLQAVLSA